jgi:O-antigen/teichoic acid export membrane protein
MKKYNFLKGATVATFYIILGKVIGILYAIPFHSLVGAKGGALYGYAYSIYTVFLMLSTVGIPLAVSKIVSEYNTKRFFKTREKVYNLTHRMLLVVSCVSSIALFILAPIIAGSMMGDIKDGNTVQDITFVIRISATALVFVSLAANMRGFLQGNKYISTSSVSQIIEQIVRVTIILLGGYLFKNVFNLGLTATVGVAVFGATVGAVFALIYLKIKISKEHTLKTPEYILTHEEQRIKDSFLIRKILITTAPFVIVGIVDSAYGFINSLTIVKTLVNLCGFTAEVAESIFGDFNNWGNKLNSIVTAVATGVTVSILPNITQDMVSKNLEGIKAKVNKTLQILIYTTLPMATGLCLLAKPVWTVFYGSSEGYKVFGFFVFTTIFLSLEMNINVILQSLNKFKVVYVCSISGLIFDAVLIVPMMLLFNNLGLGAYNGVSFAIILGLSASMAISLFNLKKYYKINYKKTLRELTICIISVLAMALVISILKIFIKIETENRILAMLLVVFYSIIGSAVYFGLTYSAKTVRHIFGRNIIKKIPFLKSFLQKK